MLTRLTVSNYALIESLDIRLDSGLTIITGETGAGKSILLGALGLVLGQRADKSALLDPKKKCIVEAIFAIGELQLESFFAENDLDYSNETCLRREINPDGKSRSFINDTPVNLSTLKTLADRLIDIHSQHETLLLQDSAFRLEVIDHLAGTSKAVAAFRDQYRERNRLQQELDALRSKEQQAIAQADYLGFQLNEMDEAQLKSGELEALETELQILENSTTIRGTLEQAAAVLTGDDQPVVPVIQTVFQSLQTLGKLTPAAGTLADRLQSARVELQDISNELELLARTVVPDPERMEVLTERIDLLNRLLTKHRQPDIDALLKLRDEMQEQLNGYQSMADEILRLDRSITLLTETMKQAAAQLHDRRAQALPPAEKQLKTLLHEVGMTHAQLQLKLQPVGAGLFRPDGSDQPDWQFSANKGMPFQEVSKVASGGELSRLMLCLKSLIADASGLPTLVFDEIDTGISGAVAGRVGAIVKNMSNERQVVAITHLPQMAAKGNAHLHVYKVVKGSTTRTAIRELGPDERVIEIARMLSGDEPSKAALSNARELLEV